MEPLDVFTAQDLARRPEDLFRDAEQGKLALITKDGRPVMVAVPFDERLLDLGIHRAMAVHLFESGQATMSQGARLAGVSLEGFIEILGTLGIPAVDYPPEELEEELKAFR